MKKDKELGAIRVMEALSAIDEELLERSGKTSAQGKDSGKIRRFVRKYAAACAACFCLAVLGAAYFGMSRLRMESASDGSKGMNLSGGSAGQNMEAMEEAAGNAPDGIQEEPEMQENAEGCAPADDVAAPVRLEPEWLDVEQLAARPEEVGGQESAEAGNKYTNEHTKEYTQELGGQQRAEQDTDPDAAAVPEAAEQGEFSANTAVPERYSPVETGTYGGDRGSMVYEWSDGEYSLWLKVTQTELTADLRFDADTHVYTVQQEWAELIPDAGADGYVQFALLYENGMLVEYCGALEREETVRLLEALMP